jgi:hypothetical protein
MSLRAEPGYNDIGLCDTSSIASDIVIPINFSLLIVTLYSSVKTALVHNDIKYPVLSRPCNLIRLYLMLTVQKVKLKSGNCVLYISISHKITEC